MEQLTQLGPIQLINEWFRLHHEIDYHPIEVLSSNIPIKGPASYEIVWKENGQRQTVYVEGSRRQMRQDWTKDPMTQRSNSSPKFLELVDRVARIIRGDAAALLNGRAEETARLILAKIAHEHGLRPPGEEKSVSYKVYYSDGKTTFYTDPYDIDTATRRFNQLKNKEGVFDVRLVKEATYQDVIAT